MDNPLDATRQKVTDALNFMSDTVQGLYYNSQAQQLGYDTSDKKVVEELDKRLKVLKNTSIEDYMTVQGNDVGSLGVQAARKQNQEKALERMRDYYARKFGVDSKTNGK